MTVEGFRPEFFINQNKVTQMTGSPFSSNTPAVQGEDTQEARPAEQGEQTTEAPQKKKQGSVA
jgi:hypothetical protein